LQFRYRGSRRESAVAQLSTLGISAQLWFAHIAKKIQFGFWEFGSKARSQNIVVQIVER
jgi:hypothetical protein